MFQFVFVLISLFGSARCGHGEIVIPRTKPHAVVDYPRQPEIPAGPMYTYPGNGV